ncbi:MBL fold metallo-hydrolase [bacterium]|nr:MAG: MBL fold metallo-hydrolase [bacterium]
MAEVIPVTDLGKTSYIQIPLGALRVNCYIVWNNASKDAFVIDPGGEPDMIWHAIARFSLVVRYVVNTHGHFDHVGANAEVKKRAREASIAIHSKDALLLKTAHEHGLFFGVKTPKQPEPDMLFKDGDILSAGSLTLKVLHTPGHTAGGVCLYDEADGLLFTGDTLFAGSVGRTDFEGGSSEVLMRSIKTKLLPLDDSVRVLPGHGPASTIGEERSSNQFIRDITR